MASTARPLRPPPDGSLAGDVLASLRSLNDRLVGDGKNRSEIMIELLNENGRLGKPLNDGEVVVSLKEWTTPATNGEAKEPVKHADPLKILLAHFEERKGKGLSGDELLKALTARNAELGSPLDERGLYGWAYGSEEGERKFRYVEAARKRLANRSARRSPDLNGTHNGQPASENVTSEKSNDVPPESENVTQKLRNSGDSGNSSKLNETHRGGEAEDGPPPGGLEPNQKEKSQEEEEDPRKSLDERLPVEVPFERYVALAVDEWTRHISEGDVLGWESDLFYFVRLVKRHPDVGKKTAEQALAKVEKVMKGWRHAQKGRDADPWWYWFGGRAGFAGIARADAQTEFLDVWGKIRYLPGMTPLDGAVELARRQPVKLSPDVVRIYSREYEAFVSIAGWLQVEMGDRNILLPVEDLAEVLGVQKMTVSRYRQWAIADGLLKEVAPAAHHPKGRKSKATEFRFDVDRVPMLREKAAEGTAYVFEQQKD